MKRPLTVAGFSFACGVLSALLFGYRVALILCALCAVLFVVCLFIKAMRKAVALTLLLFAVLGLFTGGMSSMNGQGSAELLNGASVKNGEFTVEERLGSTRAVGRLKISDSESLAAVATGKPLDARGVYSVDGVIFKIAGKYSDYYRSFGCYAELDCDRAELIGTAENNPVKSAAEFVRGECSKKLYEYLPQKQAEIIDAILLGNKSSLDEGLYDDFRSSGAAHIAVVSGMHLSVVVSLIYGALFFFTRRRRLSCLVSMTAVLCFMLITGFQLSVIRAGIMCIIMLGGSMFSRRGDSLNSLGCALLLISLLNPSAVCDVGFQLSVMSTLGIITLAPCMLGTFDFYFSGRAAKAFKALIAAPVSITVSAFIATSPIIITSFGYISVYFIITNLLISPAASLIIIFSLLFVLSSFAPPLGFITCPLALISGLLADYISFTVSAIASLPYSRLEISMPYTREIIIALAAVTAAVGIIRKTPKSILKAALSSIVAFTLIFSIFTAATAKNASLKLLSTGNGITAVLSCNGECAVISCGGSGGRYAVQTELSENGEKDLLLVKGGSRECGGVFNTAYNSAPFEKILIQDCSYNKRTLNDLRGEDITVFSDEQHIKLWDRLELIIIPLGKSTATVISIGDEYILLLPNPEYISEIPNEYRKPSLMVTTKEPDGDLISAGKTILSCNAENDRKNLLKRLYNSELLSLYQQGEIQISLGDKIYY